MRWANIGRDRHFHLSDASSFVWRPLVVPIDALMQRQIPVIDLFAGPGGLGEGFSAITDPSGSGRLFRIGVSIEKDEFAHQTLQLRAFFRAFHPRRVPDAYYDLLAGRLTPDELLSLKRYASESEIARAEAVRAELGVDAEDADAIVDGLIQRAVGGTRDWVLIGGPPCQAFSLAGRSRMSGESQECRDSDPRHLLYKQYLRVISVHEPAIFVMENVKGILSSTHHGTRIFDRILDDLSQPAPHLNYELRSLVLPREGTASNPKDFVIRSELFSVPQARHRVILLGVRSDYAHLVHRALAPAGTQVTLKDVISGFPKVRSRLSRRSADEWGVDSHENWLDVLKKTRRDLAGWKSPYRSDVVECIERAVDEAADIGSPGAPFLRRKAPTPRHQALAGWLVDGRIEGICHHDARSHMASDLHRYMFLSSYAKAVGKIPKLDELPERLKPAHENASDEKPPHADRFKVHPWSRPAWTITSHIAKDGHYFVHPDPAQCRSFTVREAARIQTFPDNYFFVGGRTEQYTQVGNAVPPFLARQIGEIVADLMLRGSSKQDRFIDPLDHVSNGTESTGERTR